MVLMLKKIWNKSPLSCAHSRHDKGHKCPDCGARVAPRPQFTLVAPVRSALTDDDYGFAVAVERDVLAARR